MTTGPLLAKLEIRKALPIIRAAYDAGALRAQTQDGSKFKDFEEVVSKYTKGHPIGLCLDPEIADTLDHYWPEAWWSVGLGTFLAEGILECDDEEAFLKLEYTHQAWFRGGQNRFEATLEELEDWYIF